MIDAQLVGDSLVFSRKEIENAKVAAVVSDVFGHLVVGLSEIDDAAFSVPAVDEIVDDAVLFAFGCPSEALQAKGFHHQVLRWSDIQRGGQHLRQSLAREPDTCFGGGFSKRDKLCQKRATRKACAAGCLFFQNCSARRSTSEKNPRACWDLLACRRLL